MHVFIGIFTLHHLPFSMGYQRYLDIKIDSGQLNQAMKIIYIINNEMAVYYVNLILNRSHRERRSVPKCDLKNGSMKIIQANNIKKVDNRKTFN